MPGAYLRVHPPRFLPLSGVALPLPRLPFEALLQIALGVPCALDSVLQKRANRSHSVLRVGNRRLANQIRGHVMRIIRGVRGLPGYTRRKQEALRIGTVELINTRFL